MRVFSLDDNAFTEIANQIKEVLVDHMAGEGLIDHDIARGVKRDWAIVIKEKGLFGKLWDKWRNITEDGHVIAIVRACRAGGVGIEDPPEEEETKEETKEEESPTTAGRFDLEV